MMVFTAAETPVEEIPEDESKPKTDDRVVIFPGVNLRQVARMLKFFEGRRKKKHDDAKE